MGKRAANEHERAPLLRNPLVHVLDVDDAASRSYAEIVVALPKAGTPLPSNDRRRGARGRRGSDLRRSLRAIGRVGARVYDNA